MKKKIAWFVPTVTGIILLDQFTKIWIHKNYGLYQSTEVIKGLFNITYIRNSGAAFGFLANSAGLWVPIFFISIAIVALIVIFYLFVTSDNIHPLSQAAYALIFGGALGNLIDRITRGEVVDFIDFYWGKYHWPAFNIADSSITVGVFLFIFSFLITDVFRPKETLKKNSE